MNINRAGYFENARLADTVAPAAGSKPFIRLDRVYKIHEVANVGVAALGGVSLDIDRGEFAAIVGPSGAGKSTILNLIGGVDTATAGLVSVGGTDLSELTAANLSEYRRVMVGFLWQGTTKNLIPYLTVAQNAELPLLLGGVRSAANRRRRTGDLLELLGLADRARHLPTMLSGGEQQRAGLVVALVHDPAVVLADEPTAEIDAEGADQVVKALRAACTELGSTVVMATHDLIAASKTDVTFRLIDGRIRGPAGRASLDPSGRIALPEAAASLLGSAESELAVELVVELEGDEVRIRSIQETIEYQPRGTTAGAGAPARSRARATTTSERAIAYAPPASTAAKPIREPLLAAEGLCRTYGQGATITIALRDVALQLAPGELVVVIGPSGSGKSTLLGIIGGFEPPDSGTVKWHDRLLAELSATEIARRRASEFGLVFQSLGLFPALTARENVYLPLLISGADPDTAAAAADRWIQRLDLQDRAEHRLFELSLGQQQRIAVARALAPDPDIVLADEPTAELDHEAANVVIQALKEVSQRGGGVILASHDPRVLQVADRVLALRAGRLVAHGSPDEVAAFLTTD
ncbi:MAG: ABC transporter ATP-binding protein [Streptosporangiaceae bacterium]